MSEYIITCSDELAMWLEDNDVSLKEIVCCKDCNQRESDYCHWIDRFIKSDGFCAWGERK